MARRLGLERSHGVGLAVNAATAFVATGDWARPRRCSRRRRGSAAPSGPTTWRCSWPSSSWRAASSSARARHLDAAAPGATRPFAAAKYAGLVAELALWEGRVDDAAARSTTASGSLARRAAAALRARAADGGGAGATRRGPARLGRRRVAARALAAKLRDEARARPRQPPSSRRRRRRGAASARRSTRGSDGSPPAAWHAAAAAFDPLDRPYVAAYCRWREAEATSPPPRHEHGRGACARRRTRSRAACAHGSCSAELELLAQRARIYLVEPSAAERADELSLLASELGVTAREAEVLELVARGYTNREIGESLFVSAKTASVHVTHILRKLGSRAASKPPRPRTASQKLSRRPIGDPRGPRVAP